MTLAVLGCGLMSVSVVAGATENSSLTVAPQGFYVEATGGVNLYATFINETDDSNDIGIVNQRGISGFGVSGALGYRFKPNGVAVEAGMMYSSINVDLHLDAVTDGVEGGKTENVQSSLYMPYFAARWDVDLGNGFAFIPKIGLMVVKPSGRASQNVVIDGQHYTADAIPSTTWLLPFVGLGMSYQVNQSLSVALQYQGALYAVVNGGQLSLGLDWHFA